jgi:hypothetical protein
VVVSTPNVTKSLIRVPGGKHADFRDIQGHSAEVPPAVFKSQNAQSERYWAYSGLR